jgi:5-methylcytosine-specific restriction endonuclease McrA
LAKNDHGALRFRIIKNRGAICERCGKQLSTPRQEGSHIINYTNFGDIVMDHIIPISIGGAEFDENNVQLLCRDCNKVKTREDAKQIAKARRVEKIVSNGQKILVNY